MPWRGGGFVFVPATGVAKSIDLRVAGFLVVCTVSFSGCFVIFPRVVEVEVVGFGNSDVSGITGAVFIRFDARVNLKPSSSSS